MRVMDDVDAILIWFLVKCLTLYVPFDSMKQTAIYLCCFGRPFIFFFFFLIEFNASLFFILDIHMEMLFFRPIDFRLLKRIANMDNSVMHFNHLKSINSMEKCIEKVWLSLSIFEV